VFDLGIRVPDCQPKEGSPDRGATSKAGRGKKHMAPEDQDFYIDPSIGIVGQ
jgi:hypothetical protein